MSSTEEPSDDDKLAGYADELRRGIETHTPWWVSNVMNAHLDPERATAVATSLEGAVDQVLAEVAELLATDIDAQRSNPLAVIRSLVSPMTAALRTAGVPSVPRDPDATRLFPDDVFDLTPGAFSDIHPDLHMPGLAWGAAKAHVHIQRRRTEGLR